MADHTAIFFRVHVAFRTGEQQGAVVFEVAVPFDQAIVAPVGIIAGQFFVAHAIEISAQVVAGFIRILSLPGFVLEVPNWLFEFHNRRLTIQFWIVPSTTLKENAFTADGIRKWLPSMPFNALLGLRLHRMHKDGITICCDVRPELLNSAGVLHGGVTATLADAAVGIATTRHYKGRPITTIELKVNYFRPLPLHGKVFARARLMRTGATLSVGQVEIRDDQKNLAGIAIVTYILLDARK